MDTYEEKYKKALEKARQLYAYPTTKPFTSDLQDIFPELKESEDEKIRKKLIEVVKGDMVVGGTKDKQLAIAWLDKQGEKKTAWSEEDEREIEHCIDFLNHPDMIRTTPTVVKGCKNWLKDLKDRVQPQTTWKPSDEHIHGLIWVINRMPDIKKANEAEAVLRDLLEQLNKLRKE